MNDQSPASDTPTTGRVHRPQPAHAVVGWQRWLPCIQTLRRYQLSWLRHDLVAGLVLTAVLVPVGIAYAVAAGVPAISGLYATIFGLLAHPFNV